MADEKVELIGREERHRGFFGLDRLTLRHRRFDGGWTEPMMREVLLQKRAVGLLPYDPVADRVVLIEQFRSGAWVAGEPAWMIEVVAGIVGPGEAHEDVARREAMEEAGLTVGALEPIAAYAPSPGASTEWVTLFAGRVSAPPGEGLFGLAAEHEDIRAFSLPAADAIAWLDGGRISNAVTIIALSWLARHHGTLRRRWLRQSGG
jgi:ADP-ribose pyrophosphatase